LTIGGVLATHWLLALQVCPVGQVPQASVPPQPSLILPQIAPSAVQVVGVHATHWLSALQDWPVGQVPQASEQWPPLQDRRLVH
jgi:hypothetical protein